MAQQESNQGGFFTVVPLDTEGCAATVEVRHGQVRLSVADQELDVCVGFTRREARGVALAMVDASQQITEKAEEE